MNILVAHIEYLLTIHNCVCVPGLGGFLLSRRESVYLDKDILSPPAKIVQFNKSLNYNDGLLVSSVIRERGISYDDALYIVNSEVEVIKQRIQAGKTESFGTVGSLKLNSDGNLEFIFSESNYFDLSLYGLPIVRLSKLDSSDLDDVQDTKLYKINSSGYEKLYDFRRVVAVVILILGFLFVSNPINRVGDKNNMASLISTNLFSDLFVNEFSYYSSDPDLLLDTVTPSFFDNEPVLEVDNSHAIDQKSSISDVVSVNSEAKRYYVIIASYPDRALANKRVKVLNKQGYESVEIIEKSGKYRIYLRCFDDKEFANRYLDELKERTSFKDAWIFSHIS